MKKSKQHQLKVISILLITLGLTSVAGPCVAIERDSLVGPHPYDFPFRDRTSSLVLEENRRRASAPAAGACCGQQSGVYSNSTAVGNWQQIEMILGDGAVGTIIVESDQNNEGNSYSVSDVLNERKESTTDDSLSSN